MDVMNAPWGAAARRAGITRKRIAVARMCCERLALSAFSPTGGARSRILCYHAVGTPEWGVNDLSPARFRRQLEGALDSGYRFVPAEMLAREGGNARRLAITFDDGLTSVAANAAPVLRELGIPWTLFVVSDWADGRHAWARDTMLDWRAIERLAAEGATVGSHSVSHPDFGRIPAEAMEAELQNSRRTIAERIGIDTRSFAIPLGQAQNWNARAQTAAMAAGYELVFAQSEERRHPGTVARTFITRFDGNRVFKAALDGAFDRWEEWV